MKGGPPPPFHKKVTTNRNSPPRAAGAQGSFDSRREAPGGSGGGLNALPLDHPNQSSDVPPRSETGAPSGPRASRVVAYCRVRKKQMAANSVRCQASSGESVKGGILPFHKSTMTNRNSPPRAAGAQGSFDSRREAPGGSGGGLNALPLDHPNQSSDVPPGPLDPDRRSETGAPSGPRASRVVAYCRVRKKQMAANSVRCASSGESVKGGILPFHKSTMTNRNSPPRAAGAQGSFDSRREAPGSGRSMLSPANPAPVAGRRDRRRSETGAPRREHRGFPYLSFWYNLLILC